MDKAPELKGNPNVQRLNAAAKKEARREQRQQWAAANLPKR